MSETLEPREKEHIVALGLDEKRVGEKLGSGWEYRVFKYGDSEVVRIPVSIDLPGGPQPFRSVWQMRRDLGIVRRYFPKEIPQTKIRAVRDKFCVIQEFLPDISAVKLDEYRKDETLRTATLDVLQRVDLLLKEQDLYLDLVGAKGYTTAGGAETQLANLLTVGSWQDAKRLAIADCGLKPGEYKWIQNYMNPIIEKYFGYEMHEKTD